MGRSVTRPLLNILHFTTLFQKLLAKLLADFFTLLLVVLSTIILYYIPNSPIKLPIVFITIFIWIIWILFSLVKTFRSINTFLTKFIVSILQLILQTVFLFIIFFIFLLSHLLEPTFEKNNQLHQDRFILKMKDEYGIKFSEDDEIKHFSYFRYADDYGVDLIIENFNLNFKNYISKNGIIENLDPKNVQLWHTQHLCDGEELEIKDKKIRNIICSLNNKSKILPMSGINGPLYTNDIPSNATMAIFFPDENLVWIKVFDW